MVYFKQQKMIIAFIFGFVILFIILGLIRTYQTQHKPQQTDFLKGTIPSPAPDGFYSGGVAHVKVAWSGKSFHAKNNTGINNFKTNEGDVEKYPFKTYVGKGLQDKHLDVLKIDYNIPQNPWWLKPVLDEIVQVGEDSYLGKVHMHLIPGLPFTLGYFTLKK